MSKMISATPRCSVWLYKCISRETVDGVSGVSARYQGKTPYIDLTPFLGDGATVRTTKSVRDPAGGFSISFLDSAQRDVVAKYTPESYDALESVYGLVEPMDIIEIRMWSGVGALPLSQNYPVIMRGFVSEIQRGQAIGEDGRPQRTVTISGQDYGKIWQMFQILYLPAYAQGKALLTSYALYELFGVSVQNAMEAGEFVRTMVDKVINLFLSGFLPDTLPIDIPKKIQTGDSISVKHGTVNESFQKMQGSVYDILKHHGDIGIWNELFIEDREDGVHCVYRPIPALHITLPKDATDRKIQPDAVDPIYILVPDDQVQSLSVSRSDANVANFFWVNNSRFDLVDEQSRKLFGITEDSASVSLSSYPNAAVKYYGVRPMYGETQQGGDGVTNQTSGLPQQEQDDRSALQEPWIERRRRHMIEMQRDNVVFERGTARIKGGPIRPSGEAMKAGDYATIAMGALASDVYVYQIEHEFVVYQSYTTTLSFERGEGFVNRAALEGTPWLLEQASKNGGRV